MQQPYLLNSLKTKFGGEEIATQGHGTQAMPWFKILFPNDENKIPIERQS
jgi:hypothetical protein